MMEALLTVERCISFGAILLGIGLLQGIAYGVAVRRADPERPPRSKPWEFASIGSLGTGILIPSSLMHAGIL